MAEAKFDSIDENAIAIVGMAARLPSITNTREYWKLLRDGAVVAEHDGRTWWEPTEYGSRFMTSARISDADVEGTSGRSISNSLP